METCPETRHSPSKLSGLVRRREVWVPTCKGWVVGSLLILTVSSVAFFSVVHFLATNAPVDSNVLVVEGWLSVAGSRRAADLIRSNDFKIVLVGGGPIDGTGEFDPEVGTYAHQGLKRLRHAGVPESLMTVVPSPRRQRDRTYTEALAIKQWFADHRTQVETFNILSESVHARRTRLLFEKAFGSDTRIGIISLPPSDYPANRWWRYSAGVKDVISEGAAYLYARFFFWP